MTPVRTARCEGLLGTVRAGEKCSTLQSRVRRGAMQRLLSKLTPLTGTSASRSTTSKSSVSSTEDLHRKFKDVDMFEICDKMRRTLKLRTVLCRFRAIRNAFTGADAIIWITQHMSGLERSEAVFLGNELLECGLIYSVVYDDGAYFNAFHIYRFSQDDRIARDHALLVEIEADFRASILRISQQDREQHPGTPGRTVKARDLIQGSSQLTPRMRFTGSEAVDFMFASGYANDRSSARRICQEMYDIGLFVRPTRGSSAAATSDMNFRSDRTVYELHTSSSSGDLFSHRRRSTSAMARFRRH